MISAYSQRLSPPFSGQAQIVESDRARAITMDGKGWEIYFMRAGGEGRGYARHQRGYFSAAYVSDSWMRRVAEAGSYEGQEVDERILELAAFIENANLPFPVADEYEYWLLDAQDESPLAMIFSCIEAEQMGSFPDHLEWTALPDAVMAVERSEAELANGVPPVNYSVERLVAERAGNRPRARWFRRRFSEPDRFPPFLLREDWEDEAAHDLCQRYIQRQSPRLLMLHDLEHPHRLRLERAASANVMEVERFHAMYPQVADQDLMKQMRVEARLRSLIEEKSPINNRRDGVLYL